MNESLMPVGLEKTQDRKLLIQWSDDTQQLISFRRLREHCPCATCIDKRLKEIGVKKVQNSGQLRILSSAEARPLEIVKMRPVGNYAYNIQFSDDHTTGIYTFGLLRSLQSDESSED